MERHATARREAMAFLAAYDGLPGDDEQRIARLARLWLSMLRTRHSIQGLVQTVFEEFSDETISGGCGWDDLRRKFTQWATDEGWRTSADIGDPQPTPAHAPRGGNTPSAKTPQKHKKNGGHGRGIA